MKVNTDANNETTLLLSFSLPSCIVTPIRKIENKNSFLYKSAMSYSMKINIVSEDVNMDISRGRSIMPSLNLSRELSIYLDLSPQLYTDRIEAKNEKIP